MKIAVFYHCKVSGGDPYIDFDHAIKIVAGQMQALKESGLAGESDHIHIGCNGSNADLAACQSLASHDCTFQSYPHSRGEHPTLQSLRLWCENHDDWMVFYHHSKGATRKGFKGWDKWRNCMERACVWGWRQCIKDLEKYDSVGVHWMTPQQYPKLVGSPYWGGNFWWARASYIRKLPVLPSTANNREEFYEAEGWIGKSNPKIIDYGHHWPISGCK